MYIDDTKMCAKNEKKWKVRIYTDNIIMEFAIEKGVI